MEWSVAGRRWCATGESSADAYVDHLVADLGARYRGYNGKGFGGPSPEA